MYMFLQQAANKFKMKFSVVYKNNTGLCLELGACYMLEWAMGYCNGLKNTKKSHSTESG